MRETTVAGVRLWIDPAEAGGRYLAPILVIPGLFQSPQCWRGMTSMLAHRGWNVYVLPRFTAESNADDAPEGWDGALATAGHVASRLDEKIIVFGADVGASLALSLPAEVRPLAVALFSPAEPGSIARAYEGSLGWLGRRRGRTSAGVAAPAAIAKRAARDADVTDEPRSFVDQLGGAPAARPREHPPAIVFTPEDDPLVASEHAAGFAETPYAKLARSKLAGRWWPSSNWEPIANEVHRFLILTLADRVVEFPDEVFEE